MVDLLELHKKFLAPHFRAGCAAADFTMGNGNDTLWLCEQMKGKGKVYAFDVQLRALQNTFDRLRGADAEGATLILDSHSNLKTYIKEPLCVGIFNLGWLPGGNKLRTTLRATTKKAVADAIDLLCPDGALLVAVYPGHEEGYLEGEMLREFFRSYSRFHFGISEFHFVNSPASPYFYLIERSEKG